MINIGLLRVGNGRPIWARFERSLTSLASTQKPADLIKPKIVRLDFNDKILSNALLQVKSKKTRMKSGMILIEGVRLLKDIMSSGQVPLMVFFTQSEDIYNIDFRPETKLFKVPLKDLKTWCDVVTPQGIMAVFKKPEVLAEDENSLPISVVCDQIRDPGNLGAILRVSAGAGVKRILLTKGCVDPWDSKVLRSGSGSHFRLPIYTDVTWNQVGSNASESSLISLATNDPKYDSNLPLYPYFEVDYGRFSNTILVIGGETEGLSQEAYQLAQNLNGIRINIPLDNQIESLNAASAASVLLFEMKKQYKQLPS